VQAGGRGKRKIKGTPNENFQKKKKNLQKNNLTKKFERNFEYIFET
jgi:hypothetical protein